MDAGPAIIEPAALDALLETLFQRGYTVIGRTVRSQSLVDDEVRSAEDLPGGWVDVQDGGTFRLERTGDGALFAHTVGHDSLKRFLFPSRVPVWRADTTDLAGAETEHTRLWDSCFTLGPSYVHGGGVRGSGRSRDRQWMTHKLASWIDQFYAIEGARFEAGESLTAAVVRAVDEVASEWAVMTRERDT